VLGQCRLADARLPGDEHQPALPLPGLGRVLPQGGQLRFPFQQRHDFTPPYPGLPSTTHNAAAGQPVQRGGVGGLTFAQGEARP
jgi:hypothetical protein